MIAAARKGEQLDAIDITTDDDRAGKAVADLNQAIEDYSRAVLYDDTARTPAGSKPWRRRG
ncbi:hypothetical protein ABIE67_006674 [Streptomyces sp. V4I8]|uniref:hypothetical protein n=1 Tax=Streptomyces sp. V4I8 TaxID=3156469 RepID=UPI0035169996